jgi:amino-acid N-acetyltransferase
VTSEEYEGLRAARLEDIPGLLSLLGPLEEQGFLVRRTRETLEHEIDRFVVIERDKMIIGCAALENFEPENVAELYCLAVHPSYRETGRGEELVEHIAEHASKRGIKGLFVLTTQTTHFFRERGFVPATLRALPEARKARYDRKRRSKVLVRDLSQ